MNIKDYLINKHIFIYNIFKKDSSRSLKQKTSDFPFQPIITISREPGSGGRPIAKALAKQLKFKYYNKELINLIAKDAKKKKEIIKEFDEKYKTKIEDFFISLFGKNNYSLQTAYYKSLDRVILKIGLQGKAVILGRGANFILPSLTTLKVRIIAPYKFRLRMALKFEKHPFKKALRIIKKTHFNRKEFIKKAFKKNISNANYYDLVINTENINIPEAVKIIRTAFKQKFS